MDYKWWREYGSSVPNGIEMWSTSRYSAKVWGLNCIRSEPGGGISDKPGVIREGGNSGFAAVSLAILFGAVEIVLLGFDMQLTGGKTHHHGDHSAALGNPDAAKLRTWCKRFAELAEALPSDVRIINASRESALTCFPRMDLDACLSEPSARRARAARGVRRRA